MGIMIYEIVSKSVTQAEWEKVYEETLVLVEAFPFAEKGTFTYAGKEVVCAVPTRERTMPDKGDVRLGWCAGMDYATLKGADDYFLSRELIGDSEVDATAGDAMLGALPAYMDYDGDDKRFCRTYSLWGAKTQGEPYHMYLLAVACLIEDRLGEKAFVYGDITQGQCRKAVELANQYLEKPIRVPAHCEMKRLYERIQKLPINDTEKIEAFDIFYLGTKDKKYYQFTDIHFQEYARNEHWKKRFGSSLVGTRGFAKNLKCYLTAGLGLEELCRISCIKDTEGNLNYEKFINAIMNCKLHLKEKNTEDYLEIEPESEQPYNIWDLFADFMLGWAHNPKVDRYIPLEEIRAALKNGIGCRCDVDKYIDLYLEKEAAAPSIDISKENLSKSELLKMTQADAAEVFMQIMDRRHDEIQSQRGQYEISDYEDLLHYKKNSSFEPGLLKALGKSYRFYHHMLQEEQYKLLMEGTHEMRCAFLITRNEQLLLRDRDWKHIFTTIKKDPKTYGRYYPMVRVEMKSKGLNQMVVAFILNDELYAFAEQLDEEAEY